MENPKKIAIVTYALNIGGMETFLFSLARGLHKHQAEPAFIVTDYIGPWHGRPKGEGFPVHEAFRGPMESRRGHAKRVGRMLEGFDAVLLNHTRTGQCAAGLLPETAVAISVLHNDASEIYEVGLENRENLDRIVAVSEKVRSEAIRNGAEGREVVCVRNGVEVLSDFPKKERIFSSGNPLRIVFIGRAVHEQKGILYLPGIMALFKKKGFPSVLDVIGDGPDLNALRAWAEKNTAGDVIRIRGALPHKETMRLLTDADALIMPSFYEGQPIILFEAMARGVVPVVSRLEGVTDSVIKDGENGFLVPVGDEMGFAEALYNLSDRRLLKRMSRAAWETALSNFGIESTARNYIRLIDQCAEERRGGKARPRSGGLDGKLLGKRSWLPLAVQQAGWKLTGFLRAAK